MIGTDIAALEQELREANERIEGLELALRHAAGVIEFYERQAADEAEEAA